MADETTAERAGPFWDVIAGRADPPPAAHTLGWRLITVDPDSGTIEVAFEAALAENLVRAGQAACSYS